MKGLQAEQETTQTCSYQNGQEITTQEENGVDTEASKKERKPSNTGQEENGADVHRSKEENKPSNVYEIQILDNHTTVNINPGEEESNLNGNSGGASEEDEIGVCFSARIPKYSMEDGSSSCTPSVKSSSKTRQKGSPVSNENKNNGSKLKKQASSMRVKVNN